MTDERVGIGGDRHERRRQIGAAQVADADRGLHADAGAAVAKGKQEEVDVDAVELVVAVGERAQGELAQLGERRERGQRSVGGLAVELFQGEQRRDAHIELAALHRHARQRRRHPRRGAAAENFLLRVDAIDLAG